jgi:ABC-type branched-subunit amino acid transport system ATPase component
MPPGGDRESAPDGARGLPRRRPWGKLEIEGLTKRYGDVVALDDLGFDVRPGELFGFVGRNGAGKTTTMRIVLGVLAADAGEVRWAGAPITFAACRRIGYMPEERGLYPKMRVADQLRYLAELHGMAAAAAGLATNAWLERFGLADRSKDELQKLSLGNQQRVQLAAALVFAPDLLVLDEPFAGLDPVAVDPKYWPQRWSTMKIKKTWTDQRCRLLTKRPTPSSCHHCGPKKASTTPLAMTQMRPAMATTPKT